ncbi:ATP-binding cassette sub-family C member 11-like isoform X2 [Aotus nancymaae]|uniref:ATP-binding cassette sub-family C member 11-like isoform X2 n=1 Tax=Aotus nancymaae TaxID=37293 RepID=UPI0030FF141E
MWLREKAISFFTSDFNYLFEVVYYGPLLLLACSSVIISSISSYLVIGQTALIATFCYLLVFPLEVFMTQTSLKTQHHSLRPKKEGKETSGEVWACPEPDHYSLVHHPNSGHMILIHTFFKLKLTDSMAFTTVASLNPLWLSVFFVPFAVKGLTNCKSAVKRCKKFFLQESPVFYVQTLQDPSKALVLEEATLSWRQTCPGIVSGAFELERNGHASEGMNQPRDALGPEEKGNSPGPELHKINLVVSKVALSRPCRQAGCQTLRA